MGTANMTIPVDEVTVDKLNCYKIFKRTKKKRKYIEGSTKWCTSISSEEIICRNYVEREEKEKWDLMIHWKRGSPGQTRATLESRSECQGCTAKMAAFIKETGEGEKSLGNFKQEQAN